MLQRVQMFCLCAGLSLYLGFRFRYFPYSLYTFQPQIAVINVAATKSELHAHVLVGLARRWHMDCPLTIVVCGTHNPWSVRRLWEDSPNLLTVPRKTTTVFLYQRYLAEYLVHRPSCFTAFRLRDSLLPTYRFGSRCSGRGFTPAFFGGAPFKRPMLYSIELWAV